MLEIKNLTKIYKTKGGADVKALDNVSIKFEETGLVFLLGKSGSGKSTLLNLAGGLDAPTSGEVIVMGKSSKDFSDSDFDSYRNTFIGFVFQEYNVLNEFNVADNVALALELQGKTKEHDKVMQILEEVELSDYAKRKPNTLSGGQKQRIAIARALVKDPQIIMADEPTGALDSTTGKQVFDTLKNLSKTRLVLVVSHDREFAEIYGDRIVELKDGKIISDVKKVRDEAEAISGNVKRIGLDTLTVQSGAADEETMQKIRAFLSESKGEVLISRGQKEVANFRRVNRIDEKGAQERFADTEEKMLDIKTYDGKQTKFIRSRLPAKKAVRIGASGLKLKPFRLAITILLSIVSFVMFGLFSTMMLYDPEEVLVQSFMDSDYKYFTYEKHYESITTYHYDGEEYTSVNRGNQAKFTPKELSELGGEGAFGVCSVNANSFPNIGMSEISSNYYRPSINGIAALPMGHELRSGIVGKYPENDDEICVSNYFFDCLQKAKFYPLDENGNPQRTEKPIHSEYDLIGEKISFGYDMKLTVTGIFQSGEIPAQYDEIKDKTESSGFSMLDQLFMMYLESSLHVIAFGTENLVQTLAEESGSSEWVEYFEYCKNQFYGFYDYETDSSNDYFRTILNFASVSVYQQDADLQLPIYRFDGTSSLLKENELIVDFGAYWDYINRVYNEWDMNKWEDPDYLAWNQEREQLRESLYPKQEDYWGEDGIFREEEYSQALQQFEEMWERDYANRQYPKEEEYGKLIQAQEILRGNKYDEDQNPVKPSAEEIEAALSLLKEHVENFYTVTLTAMDRNYGGASEYIGEYHVVGFYYDQKNPNTYYDGVYCSQEFYDKAGVDKNNTFTETTNYKKEKDATFSLIFAPFDKNEESLKTVFKTINVKNPDNDVLYTLSNELYESVQSVNDMVSEMSLVFLIVGLVMMLFSALLLLNFITMSISNKTKEIGILRAVGARGMDVFKIFFSESGIIVGICLILAIIGSFAVSVFLNGFLKARVGMQATLFVFGPLSILLMVGVALFVALIGTFLPVYFASRKKPVESIRAL